jgi:hypothetical protein
MNFDRVVRATYKHKLCQTNTVNLSTEDTAETLTFCPKWQWCLECEQFFPLSEFEVVSAPALVDDKNERRGEVTYGT